MTTLDSFLAYLPEEINLQSGHQLTPDTLFLTYTGEDFLKILSHPIGQNFRFRFLEEKDPPNLLIHFFFTTNHSNIHVSFQVTNCPDDFRSQMLKFFPSATAFLNDTE